MFIKTVSHILKKRTRSLMTFIIIILIFQRTDNWVALTNRLNMQLISILLFNIVWF